MGLVLFGSLTEGQVFTSNNNHYVKTEEITNVFIFCDGHDRRHSSAWNAAGLGVGRLVHFCPWDVVHVEVAQDEDTRVF